MRSFPFDSQVDACPYLGMGGMKSGDYGTGGRVYTTYKKRTAKKTKKKQSFNPIIEDTNYDAPPSFNPNYKPAQEDRSSDDVG